MSVDRPGLGIWLRLLSGVLMAGMYICVKALSSTVPLGEIVFFRSIFALLPLLLFLWWRGEFPGRLASARPGGHLVRAGFGTLALFGSFAAVARLNLAEAVLILQLSPILVVVAAVFVLSERLTVWRIAGVALGFFGVVVLVWPELNFSTDPTRLIGYGIAIAAAALSALALIMVRSLNKTESPGAIAFYFALASSVTALFTLPWGWILPDAQSLVLLIGAGLFGGFAHIAMTLAFRYAEASRLAAYEYVTLLWPLLADVVIFRVSLSNTILLAAPLILSGALLATREGRRSEE